MSMKEWFVERQQLYEAAADLSIDTEVHEEVAVTAILERLLTS